MNQSLYAHAQSLAGLAGNIKQMIAERVILPAAAKMAASIKQRATGEARQAVTVQPVQQFIATKQGRGKKKAVNLFDAQASNKKATTNAATGITVENKPAQNMVIIGSNGVTPAPSTGEVQAYEAEVSQQAGILTFKILSNTI